MPLHLKPADAKRYRRIRRVRWRKEPHYEEAPLVPHYHGAAYGIDYKPVPPYRCPVCERVVQYRPCVICAARRVAEPPEDKEPDT